MEEAGSNFFRLTPWNEVRFKKRYIIKENLEKGMKQEIF